MRRFLLALPLVALAACGGDGIAPAPTLAGDYMLSTANAKTVPAVAISDSLGTVEILRGRIILRDDLSFLDSLVYRTASPGSAPQDGLEVREGTYRQTGDNVTLTMAVSGLTYAVTWIGGDALAYADDELSLIYRK